MKMKSLTDSEYVCYLISQLIQTIKLNEKKKRKLNSDTFIIDTFI